METETQEEQGKIPAVLPEIPVESKIETSTEVPVDTQQLNSECPEETMTDEEVIENIRRCFLNDDYDNNEDYFGYAKKTGLVYNTDKKNWTGKSDYKKGGEVDVTKNYYRFRQHTPEGAEECKMPEWAKKVAGSIKEGAKVITCKKGNKWFIQSILIPVKGVKIKDAKYYAGEIRYKLQTKKKALGGTIDATDDDENIEKTIRGYKQLLAYTTDEDKKLELQKLLDDLQ